MILDCKLLNASLILFTLLSCRAARGQDAAQTRADSSKIAAMRIPPADKWLAKDKADHFATSAFLVGFGYYAARKELHRSDPASKNLAMGFSFSLGIMKEVYDKTSRKGSPSLKDLAADLLGIGVGYLLTSAK